MEEGMEKVGMWDGILGTEMEGNNRDSQEKGSNENWVKRQLCPLSYRRVVGCYYKIEVSDVGSHNYCLFYRIFFSSGMELEQQKQSL